MVQHSDHDLEFQQYCINLIKKAASKNEADKRHYAYLTDRVLINQQKQQIYGTQFYLDKEKNSLVPFPVKDIKNIEARRRVAGLEPFRQYQKRMEDISKNQENPAV